MSIKNITLTAAIAALYILKSGLAAAQDVQATNTAAGPKPYAVEVKPLPLVLGAALGGAGLGLEGEALVTPHVSVLADLSAMRMHLSDQQLKSLQDNAKDQDQPETLPQSMTSTSAGFGARYYGAPEHSTWFTGATFSGTSETSHWVRGDETLRVKATSFTLGVEGGYRWLWDNGLTVRVGGGLGVSKITSRDLLAGAAASDIEQDAKDKYPTSHPTLVPVIDLGVGYAF